MDCWNLYYLTDLSVLVLLNIFVTKLVCIKLYVVYISNNRWYTHGVCTDVMLHKTEFMNRATLNGLLLYF